MRGLVPGLGSPHPLAERLPALYQEDGLARGIASAVDASLAPVFASLDCLAAYLDPMLAPHDFLDWLGGWVGVTLDHTWPLPRRRLMVASAVELYRLRGTATGLAAQVSVFTGGRVEIVESGAAGWSRVANAAIPGDALPSLTVMVTVTDPDAIAMARLDSIIAAAKPAHMPHRIEILKE
jgi:phage tail-like protein